MVHILLDMDALTGSQLDLGACGHSERTAIHVDSNIRFIVNLLVGKRIVNTDQAVAAATVDNILGLEPMEMVGGILALLQIQKLFRIDLGVFLRHMAVAVADGDEGEAELVEISQTVVGDIPAQAAVPDFVVFMALGLPFGGGEMAERRQVAMILFAHGFQLFQRGIDLGTFHLDSSLLVWCYYKKTIRKCQFRRGNCLLLTSPMIKLFCIKI